MELSELLRIGLQVQGLAGTSSGSKPTKAAPAGSTEKASADKAATKVQPANAKAKPKAATTPAPPAEGEARSMAPQNALSGAKTLKTKCLYMENTYVFEGKAKLVSIWEDGEKMCVELDETIFHPQGGGQPSDEGQLTAAGLTPLEVTFVAWEKSREGVVRHECKGDLAAWKSALAKASGGVDVSCTVNEQKRRLHARIHSAGHLIDVAVHALGFRWVPGKGYHFADGPYVEYAVSTEGRILDKDPKAKEAAVEELNAKMKELIAADSSVKVAHVDGVRNVEIGGVSCGCGGTHVESTLTLGEVVVKKLQAKKDNMRVSYTVG
eukprot:TRINITY_DN35453_c0_g1_i1.p1 TRINITY_DN35453_c0_g1~~TRINITY_DN35453_c0_g1_i1.p1  ORF type:complete len:339 (-),score=60.50 TRINITY_DN35453_c0_g1_i1:201-1169(-)